MDKDEKNQEPLKENKDGSQDQTQDEETVSKKSFDGIRNELIQTRQDKQMLTNQLSEMQQQLRETQSQIKSLETAKNDKELNELLGDDDEPVTNAKLKSAWNALKQREQQQKSVLERQEKLQNLNNSVSKMITETQDKAKFGLDWNTLHPVIQRIYAMKKAANPYWENHLLYESNPAKTLYKLALEEPDVQERVKLMENGKVLNSMENRKTDKSSVEGGSSANTGKKLTLADIARMTPKETIKYRKEIDQLLRETAKKK